MFPVVIAFAMGWALHGLDRRHHPAARLDRRVRAGTALFYAVRLAVRLIKSASFGFTITLIGCYLACPRGGGGGRERYDTHGGLQRRR